MANRHWTSNPQRSVSSKGHGPAYGRDGGKVLNDTETQPPYNANIGPDGSNLNVVGFPTVKAFTKAKFMLFGDFGSIGAAGAAQQGSNANGELIGKLGEALGSASKSIGPAMDTKATSPQTVEPGRNSGSAPVETLFSGRVRRRGET